MGRLFFHTGLASDLYEGLRKWIGRVPGGMAIASVLACGAFGAVTGSSIATVATMGSIVMPKMRRYGYDPSVVFYIESRRFLIRDSPRPATTYEQKTGGADGVKGA